MSTFKQRTVRVVCGLVCLLGSAVHGQGPLNPPGPPAPTMKTLQQIEPRTPISSLPYTINQPGSYYVTTNLTGNPGGITISASGVTLDLGGFELVGGTGNGIYIGWGSTNVAIRNGTVREWSGKGIDSWFTTNLTAHHVTLVRALGNGQAGIQLLGKGDQIIDSVSHLNSHNGFSLGDHGAIRGCAAIGNGASGIRAGAGCHVVDNRSEQNTGAGIFAFGSGNRIEANHLSGNLGAGMQTAGEGNWIVRNTARASGDGNYDLVAGSEVGPIGGMADVGDNPWANFSF